MIGGAVTPDAEVYAWAGDGGTVRAWDATSGARRAALRDRQLGRVEALALAPDARRMVTVEGALDLTVLDLERGATLTRALDPGPPVRARLRAPDGERFLCGGLAGRVSVHETATAARLLDLTGPGRDESVSCVAFAPDGERALAGTSDGRVCGLAVGRRRPGGAGGGGSERPRGRGRRRAWARAGAGRGAARAGRSRGPGGPPPLPPAPVRGARGRARRSSARRRTPRPGERAAREASPSTRPAPGERVDFARLAFDGYDPPALRGGGPALGAADFPPAAARLDGVEVELAGFPLVLDLEGREVREFLLTRFPPGCCFGAVPVADEWVRVVLRAPLDAQAVPGQAVVRGRLEVGEVLDDDGGLSGLYRLADASLVDE
ncbi:MAG: DUF3299 domain-containing protein [Planctomycetes bacterium]|nr:DUF3299 domain-containing protein [Planctomycetota bacterium]